MSLYIFSIIIRVLDNIKKSFCQALALGGTAFVSVSMGDSNFSFYLLAGVSLVIFSVILYATSPRKQTGRDRIASYEKRVFEDENSKTKAQFL